MGKARWWQPPRSAVARAKPIPGTLRGPQAGLSSPFYMNGEISRVAAHFSSGFLDALGQHIADAFT
jgi:hypothetical protein